MVGLFEKGGHGGKGKGKKRIVTCSFMPRATGAPV
jgi:hypothetical protein